MARKKNKRLVTRRDFLTATGAVIAAGALSACAPKAVVETVTTTSTAPVKTVAITPVTTTVTGTAQSVPVTLEVYDPNGSVEISQLFAKRLDTLEGKTVCELGHGIWEDRSIFDRINELLKKQYPTIKIIPYNVIEGDYFGPGDGRAYMETDEVIAKVKELG